MNGRPGTHTFLHRQTLACSLTTNGSALGSGSPVALFDVASRMISAAGRRDSDGIVCIELPGVVGAGDAVALGPRKERSGVWGKASCVVGTAIFLACGVIGTGWIASAAAASSSSSLSSTILVSATSARRTSTLKRHSARSRLGRLMRRSVSSAWRVDSNLLIAVNVRSRSDGARRRGCPRRRGEGGADGNGGGRMLGALAVALNAFGSRRREF